MSQRHPERNIKSILELLWKWKHNIIKPLGHIKCNPKRQIHSSKCLYLKVTIKSTKKGFETTEGWENKK